MGPRTHLPGLAPLTAHSGAELLHDASAMSGAPHGSVTFHARDLGDMLDLHLGTALCPTGSDGENQTVGCM